MSEPVTGITPLPAANTFPTGTEVRIHQDCLTGDGHNPIGFKMSNDNAANIWLPRDHKQLLFENFGTLAAPLATLAVASGGGRFALTADPHIPADLVLVGRSKLRIVMYTRRTGNTASTDDFIIRLGTDLVAANYANNSAVYSLSNVAANANPFDINTYGCLITFPTATTALTNRNATLGGGGTGSTWILVNTLINTAAEMAVSFTVPSLDAAHSCDLIGYQIFLE